MSALAILVLVLAYELLALTPFGIGQSGAVLLFAAVVLTAVLGMRAGLVAVGVATLYAGTSAAGWTGVGAGQDPHAVRQTLAYLGASGGAVLVVSRLRQTGRHLRVHQRRMARRRRIERARMDALSAVVWEREAPLGRLRYMSGGLARVFGPEAARWRRDAGAWDARIHPEDRERVLRAYRSIGSGNRRTRVEYRVVCARNAVRWFRDDLTLEDASGQPVLRGLTLDVTDLHGARKQAVRTERHYRDLLDGMPVGVYRAAPNGDFLTANAVLARILGHRDVEELIRSRHERDVLPQEARARRKKGGRETDEPRTYEVERKRKDGMPVWIRTTTRPVRDADAAIRWYEGTVEDITAQKLAEEGRRTAESRFRGLVEQSLVGIYIVQDDRIVYANPKFAQIFGYEPAEIEAFPGMDELVAEEDRSELRSYHRSLLRGEEPEHHHGFRGVRSDGTPLYAEVHVGTTRYRGRLAVIGTLLDITARKEAEHTLVHNALHDELTGLPNRTLFIERLEHALHRAKRGRGGCAVLFMDLDRFKYINDSFGHHVGDELLKKTADRLRSVLRPDDSVARFGGDEFAFLLEGVDDPAEASRIVTRIQGTISRPMTLDGLEVFVSSSVGIVLSTTGYDHADDILRNADLAMYRAKENGAGRAELFDRSMHTETLGRLQLETDLRHALERGGELDLHFQPIVALGDRRVVAAEALIRWHHPEKGLIRPDQFIPVAEETGLIKECGRWVLDTACRRMANWHRRFPAAAGIGVSVNVSAKQFLQGDLVQDVKEALAASRLDARSLTLEVTETMLMENPDAAGRILGRLRDLGVRIHLDDFGTGHSSLSYLHLLPFDALKIDRCFVDRVEEGGWQSHLVRTMVNLAHDLGVRAITEGIETAGQMAYLQSLGCELAQGYLFSRPLPREDFEALCAAAPAAGPIRCGVEDGTKKGALQTSKAA